MEHSALAQLLFSGTNKTLQELEQQYPPRKLAKGAQVCRMAPSPTGFMHLGNLYGAIADERLAHQSGGVCFLRIEDTDQKRQVPGGVQTILDTFSLYQLPFDEGAIAQGDEGDYGPYRQRQRADIYHICAKYLVAQGAAYPCFLSEDELSKMRDIQAAQKLNFGCYGAFAPYRNAGIQQVQQLISQGKPYVLRYKSGGNSQNRAAIDDLLRGQLTFPENEQDVVLLKADGIPTYHFAHVVDDHFMRTTLVIRGEEWLATLPIHVQLFAAMGWQAPRYLHTAQLMKEENGKKRKLSKRQDPELALDFYSKQGYTVASVKEYLLTLLNSNYEDWRSANPGLAIEDFKFSAKKMSVSGSLFNIDKLNDVARNVLSRMGAQEVYAQLLAWAQVYAPGFAALLQKNSAYSLAMLAVGRSGKNPRKDLACWGQAQEYFSFYFSELFSPNYTLPPTVPPATAGAMLLAYRQMFSPLGDDEQWFNTVKQLATNFGYATNMKEYRQNPGTAPGSVADVSMVLRLAITGRSQSPELAQVMRVLGDDMVHRRLAQMAENMGK